MKSKLPSRGKEFILFENHLEPCRLWRHCRHLSAQPQSGHPHAQEIQVQILKYEMCEWVGNVGASKMKECVRLCNRSECVRAQDEYEHLWVRLCVGVWHKRVCVFLHMWFFVFVGMNGCTSAYAVTYFEWFSTEAAYFWCHTVHNPPILLVLAVLCSQQ